jgi:mannose-6-phosphate isomerase-like protein (cupin superfamily)
MANTGDVFEMPDGAKYIVRTSSADARGEYVEFEWVYAPGVFAPPPHIHPSQVEDYEILEGELEVMIGDQWRTLRTGESASVPVGVNHTFKRPKQFVRVRNFHRPALGFEDYIEGMHRLSQAKKIRGLKDPRLPIYLAMQWKRYPETLQATRKRERIGMAAAVGLGRILRMQPD